MIAILGAFLVVRLPVALRQPGGQDEEWYALPGLLVAREGVPRVPYAVDGGPNTVFQGADRILFAMPPASFYLQAPFFLVMPPTYGTARMASVAAGCIAIIVVFRLGVDLLHSQQAAFWAAGVYSVSRLFYFPATFARPDMICGMFGLLAVWGLWRWTLAGPRATLWLGLAGASLGLAGLSHPFAIVFALQLFPWLWIHSRRLRAGLVATLILTASTMATFAMWLPLVLSAPDLFRSQFLNNIVAPAGPGLLTRLVMPWSSVAHHLPQLITRAHPIQFSLFAVSWIGFGGLVWRGRKRPQPAVSDCPQRGAQTLWWLAGSSAYLLIACQGHHPMQGYWCYPAALMSLCLGTLIAGAVGGGARPSTPVPPRTPNDDSVPRDSVAESVPERPQIRGTIAVGLIALAMLPGSGLRATWAYLAHPGDPAYDRAAFAEQLLAELPADAKLSVGIEFAVDVYGLRSQRRRAANVVLGIRNPMYFDSTTVPTDYAILGRLGLSEGLDEAFGGEAVGVYGVADDEFACYAEVYRVP